MEKKFYFVLVHREKNKIFFQTKHDNRYASQREEDSEYEKKRIKDTKKDRNFD